MKQDPVVLAILLATLLCPFLLACATSDGAHNERVDGPNRFDGDAVCSTDADCGCVDDCLEPA